MDRSGKTALLVMACAIAFSGGIFAGYIKNRDDRPKKETPENVPVNVVSEKTQYETPTQRETEKRDEILNYLVALSGDELEVYEVYESGRRGYRKRKFAQRRQGNARKRNIRIRKRRGFDDDRRFHQLTSKRSALERTSPG